MSKPQGFSKTIDMGDGRPITIETGRLAKQADGSVVLSQGNAMLLATVVSNKEASPGVDFLPLSVDYLEKFSAAGRFPGGFLKRETRPGEHEILVSRLVDRALRPLFPDDYHAETQVIISLISMDETVAPDALAAFAASAAITITDIPFGGPISEVRVARINGEFVVNPSIEDIESADIELIVSGTLDTINMVEGEMSEVSEQDMVQAINVAHEAIKKQCQLQLDLREAVGAKPAREYSHEENDEELEAKIKGLFYDKIYAIAKEGLDKHTRSEKFKELIDGYIEELGEEAEELEVALSKKYFKKAMKRAVRDMVLNERIRLDGRQLDEVRPIWCEVDYLKSVHGSSVFTRGETQALAAVTLGTKLDEQMIDSVMLKGYKKFLLHYNFPPFSTGEARFLRGTSRREIGHGNLALRALKKVLPPEEENPYTIRVTSEVLESNGSSSMATVCSGSMALMDAGVKLSGGVSGIAMGLISDPETGKYAILSDILGDEDHLGDMDFKVTGTEKGITACQMDIKVDGLTSELLEEALMQAKAGREHILSVMNENISVPREDYKPFVPRIEKVIIHKDFIGAVIGPGGKVIQEIQAQTETTIAIEEVDNTGVVQIAAANKDAIEKAKNWILSIAAVPEVGTVYEGEVKSIQSFGAFVEFMPGKQGLLHISEIAWERLKDMEGIFKEGEKVQVKLTEVDQKTGKFRLSRKVLLEKPEGYSEPTRGDRPRRPRDGDRNGSRQNRVGGDRRPRREDRGPREQKED